MNLWESIVGAVRAEITCPVPEEMLSTINSKNIPLFDLCPVSSIAFKCRIKQSDYERLYDLVHRAGGKVEICGHYGIRWSVLSVRKRLILLMAAILLFVFTMVIPTRVFFIDVEGNKSLSDAEIIEAAKACGIRFGVSRRQLRSESVKNLLLEALPQLQWAGINTKGCTVRISVREGTGDEKPVVQSPIGSIVSGKDGVIRSMTVLKGEPLCKEGDTVVKGQVLVSGYINRDLYQIATGAEAEILGDTKYQISAIAPEPDWGRGNVQETKVRYSILIGKIFINLSTNSGISDTTCDKMYSCNYITLPGGFRLPLGIACERYVFCDKDAIASADEPPAWLRRYTEGYVKDAMLSGYVRDSVCSLEEIPGGCLLRGEYFCTEMLGRIQFEENWEYNGENH